MTKKHLSPNLTYFMYGLTFSYRPKFSVRITKIAIKADIKEMTNVIKSTPVEHRANLDRSFDIIIIYQIFIIINERFDICQKSLGLTIIKLLFW